ncbi:MAG TPA: DoxX family protein [Lautropia sp.]|nr:DoxX family protein [Lautropia sp.]
MAFNESGLSTWAPRLLSVLRIMTAYTFIQHGSAKLLGFPKVEMFANLQFVSLYGLAGVLELVGGFLLLIGLFTRPVAFVLSGMMAVAYFMAHNDPFFSPMLNRGEAAYLFCFVFLYLSAAGGGPWSVDAARGRSGTRLAGASRA